MKRCIFDNRRDVMGSVKCYLQLGSILLFVLSTTSWATAESLRDIYLKAKANDPTLEAAGYLREATRESQKQAWALLWPSINATYRYSDTSQDILTSDNDVYDQGPSDYKTNEYAFTLKQPIFEYSLFVDVSQANVEQQKADLELVAANQDLMLRVTERYLKVLAAQDQVELSRAELAAIRQHYELASARFEMGLVPVTGLHDAKARLSSREARITEVESQLADALQALMELTGEVPKKLLPLRPESEMPAPSPDSEDQWADSAARQNLAVEAKRLEVKIAGKEVSKQRSGHYPTVELLGRFSNQDTDGTLFGGGSEVENEELALQVNLPIFQGGYVNSRTRQALQLQNKVQADLRRLTLEVIRLARSSYLGVKSSIAQVNALQEAVTSQESALEGKQEGYRAGLFTSLAVLDAERDLFLAKLDLLQARYNYIFNSMKLRQAVGMLSEEDLVQAGRWFDAP